jgi:hypothetical protein
MAAAAAPEAGDMENMDEMWNDIENMKKSKLNREMIWKIQKKSKLNSEKIWKLWKKSKFVYYLVTW